MFVNKRVYENDWDNRRPTEDALYGAANSDSNGEVMRPNPVAYAPP